jgi:hypothetical protein
MDRRRCTGLRTSSRLRQPLPLLGVVLGLMVALYASHAAHDLPAAFVGHDAAVHEMVRASQMPFDGPFWSTEAVDGTCLLVAVCQPGWSVLLLALVAAFTTAGIAPAAAPRPVPVPSGRSPPSLARRLALLKVSRR